MAEDENCRWRRYVPGACSEEDLRSLRALLASYTEAEISRYLSSCPEELTPLDTLIRLFHQCHFASEADLQPTTLALLDRLGLIARDAGFPGLVYSTVAILRVEGELTVCDRGGPPDGSEYPPESDVVYPPIFDNSLRYLASLPSAPCEAMLELGTGAGSGAIAGARYARHVWATDITTRAVQFTAFSCRLAGLDNVTVLQGDLYHPVEGLTFDRIVFHPPWVPAAQSAFDFSDGGDDGEAILRGAIEGLSRFLRPGGGFYAMLLASDRAGETFEQRVRRWLGAAEDQFDVTVAVVSRDSTSGFLAQNLARGSIGQAEIPLWTELWSATRTEAILYGHLIVQRHEGERKAVTKRVQGRGIVRGSLVA